MYPKTYSTIQKLTNIKDRHGKLVFKAADTDFLQPFYLLLRHPFMLTSFTPVHEYSFQHDYRPVKVTFPESVSSSASNIPQENASGGTHDINFIDIYNNRPRHFVEPQ